MFNTETEKYDTQFMINKIILAGNSSIGTTGAIAKSGKKAKRNGGEVNKEYFPLQKVDPADMFGKQRVLKPNTD